MYVSKGQYMPDVNGFVGRSPEPPQATEDADATQRCETSLSCSKTRDKGPGHGLRRAQTYRQLSQKAQTSRATERVESDAVGAAVEERAHANPVVRVPVPRGQRRRQRRWLCWWGNHRPRRDIACSQARRVNGRKLVPS